MELSPLKKYSIRRICVHDFVTIIKLRFTETDYGIQIKH